MKKKDTSHKKQMSLFDINGDDVFEVAVPDYPHDTKTEWLPRQCVSGNKVIPQSDDDPF